MRLPLYFSFKFLLLSAFFGQIKIQKRNLRLFSQVNFPLFAFSFPSFFTMKYFFHIQHNNAFLLICSAPKKKKNNNKRKKILALSSQSKQYSHIKPKRRDQFMKWVIWQNKLQLLEMGFSGTRGAHPIQFLRFSSISVAINLRCCQ